ncbi:hypothetical protein I4U23_016519 [Adineta vaga]|nr:hypothetical protein I4U23_016519 [Adineta vaga]
MIESSNENFSSLARPSWLQRAIGFYSRKFHFIAIPLGIIMAAVHLKFAIEYFNQCPIQPMIPIYMIVNAAVHITVMIFAISGIINVRCNFLRGLEEYKSIGLAILAFILVATLIIFLFNFAWLITGSVWIFGAKVNGVQGDNPNNPNSYCQSELFRAAFVLLVVNYIIHVVIILLIILRHQVSVKSPPYLQSVSAMIEQAKRTATNDEMLGLAVNLPAKSSLGVGVGVGVDVVYETKLKMTSALNPKDLVSYKFWASMKNSLYDEREWSQSETIHIPFEVEPSDKIGSFKEDIYNRTGIPPDCQKLIFKGEQCRLELTFSDIGIRDGNMIGWIYRTKEFPSIEFHLENIQDPDHMIIWLDRKINKPSSYENLKNAFLLISEELQSKNQSNLIEGRSEKACFTNYTLSVTIATVPCLLEIFSSFRDCLECFQRNINKRIFFITSNTMGRLIVPLIMENPKKMFDPLIYGLRLSIYIFRDNFEEQLDWAFNYRNHIQLFTFDDNLFMRLLRDMADSHLSIGKSLLNNSSSHNSTKARRRFLWAQKLFERYVQDGAVTVIRVCVVVQDRAGNRPLFSGLAWPVACLDIALACLG